MIVLAALVVWMVLIVAWAVWYERRYLPRVHDDLERSRRKRVGL